MKRIVCALLSVACLFSVTPAHARLVEVIPKFTYARIAGSQIPDSTAVTGGASATYGVPNKTDTTAWVDLRSAAFNEAGKNGVVAAPDSILGIRVVLSAIDDPAGDGSFSVTGADSEIVSLQIVPFVPLTGNPAQGTIVTAVSADRQDHSTSGNKYFQLVTAIKVNPGLHAAPTAGLLTGVAACRVIVKQDNTQPMGVQSNGPSRWQVKVQYLTNSDLVTVPTGSR